MLCLGMISACSDYVANNPAFYCDDIVQWPVSSRVQSNAWTLNKQAYSLYFDLKTRYLDNNDTNAPSLSCLAVARQFFCAYSFPYCKDDINESERGVCSFLCDIWKNRCPDEPYDLYCKNKASTDCSFSVYLKFLGVLLLVI